MTPKIKQMKVAELREHQDNPRLINPERFQSLKRALESDPEMMAVRPIIALPDGQVIAGNMRLRAAIDLGWKTVPCAVVDLDEEQARLWMLKDNNHYGEWDDAPLRTMLEALPDLDLSGLDLPEIPERMRGFNSPTVVAIGALRRLVEPGALDEWAAAMTEEFGENAAVLAEISRRLGLEVLPS